MGLLTEQTVAAEVLYYGLWMQDIGASFDDEPAPDAAFGSGGGSRVVIHSGGHTHTARLHAQVWDAEPPAAPGRWEESQQTQIDAPAGELRLRTYGAMTPELIALGEAGRTWNVRIQVSGRAEVKKLAALDVPDGIEQYLLQFWPV
ncbi:hypothetical protein [Streptomyces sp. VRA16 Mangrove soil]|uniref:hypothetical protein n=1 Tax=Streptomyces sp. VRA16 Mangrove soil TaxID=2817434 RepID=UPI001A9F8281|nr:hypothetical protein [Streptomyces sp. VRA16 Mangrove soil]MBO1332625.1 hypothetical protein [Streptomyces sp. VRA16 Mangrove soil]